MLPDADGVFGRVPQCILDDEGAQLLAVHENSLDLSQIHHISENAYKQYLKSRPSPSPESIKRVKNTDLSTLAVHPLLGQYGSYPLLGQYGSYPLLGQCGSYPLLGQSGSYPLLGQCGSYPLMGQCCSSDGSVWFLPSARSEWFLLGLQQRIDKNLLLNALAI